MKKTLILLACTMFLLVSCKNNAQDHTDITVKKETQKAYDLNDPDVYAGEFIYLADAAVLTTKSEIYAVQLDEKMHELHDLAKPLQKSSFDMVNVVIKGAMIDNPLKIETGEGWDKMIVIKKIYEVTPATTSTSSKEPQVITIQDVK